MATYDTKDYKLAGFEGEPLNLYVAPGRLFLPNALTIRFSRAILDRLGTDISGKFADIGTGVGPIAIWAAKTWDVEVHAVDPVAEHIEIGRMNVKKYELEDRVHMYTGEFFSSFSDGEKFDYILCDVSGIADKAARALGWYPADVPTGGEDGTDVICAFLEQAPKYLAEGAEVYFAMTHDLSDGAKILEKAKSKFKSVTPLIKNDGQRFTMSDNQYKLLCDAYPSGLPSFINVAKEGRHVWRAQFYVVSDPK